MNEIGSLFRDSKCDFGIRLRYFSNQQQDLILCELDFFRIEVIFRLLATPITCKDAWLCKKVGLPALVGLVRLLRRCRRTLPGVWTARGRLLHWRRWACGRLVVEPNVHLIRVDLFIRVLGKGFDFLHITLGA